MFDDDVVVVMCGRSHRRPDGRRAEVVCENGRVSLRSMFDGNLLFEGSEELFEECLDRGFFYVPSEYYPVKY